MLVNARAGSCSTTDIRCALDDSLAAKGLAYTVHLLEEGEGIRSVACRAERDGYDVIIAAGGDGTVSAVANSLVHRDVCMGIIPLGTTNVLARELGIPLDLAGACKLIAGPQRTVVIDAMKVGEEHYFTQLGIGVDAAMIRDTSVEQKKRLGLWAYVRAAIGAFLGARPHRLSIQVDGRRVRRRAIQVLLANCGTLGASRLRWGPGIRPDDGQIDICILQARTILESLGVCWQFLLGRQNKERNVTYVTARDAVAVSARHPLPVQGDGELLGHTPLEVQVVAQALRIIAPATSSGPNDVSGA